MDRHEDDIRRYANGSMSPAERHALEKKALHDPFLRDALEGAESVGGDVFAADTARLNEIIRTKMEKPASVFSPLRIAAGIILLAGAFLTVFMLTRTQPTEQLAQHQTPAVDSVLQPRDTARTLITQVTPEKVEPDNAVSSTRKPSPGKPADIAASQPADEESKNSELMADKAGPSKDKQVETESAAGQAVAPLSTEAPETTLAHAAKEEVSKEVSAKRSVAGKAVSAADKKQDAALREDISLLREIVVTQNADDVTGGLMVKAQPVGGLTAYGKYLEDNLRYPADALRLQIKGEVTLQFVVNADGSLRQFTVLKGLGHGCDEEAIRLVKEGPAWSPTTIDKVAVESTAWVRLHFDPQQAER